MNQINVPLLALVAILSTAMPVSADPVDPGVCVYEERDAPANSAGTLYELKFGTRGDTGILHWAPELGSSTGTWRFSGACGLIEYVGDVIDYIECMASNPSGDCPMPPIIEGP